MKERGIIFSGDNPKLIQEGRKTQTRRIWRQQPRQITDMESSRRQKKGDLFLAPDIMPTSEDRKLVIGYAIGPGTTRWMGSDQFIESHCPYGVAGDRLWVRESFAMVAVTPTKNGPVYLADGACAAVKKWRPSIFMPKWAARIWLEITRVRVERVQDISWEDCIAEGTANGLHYAKLWDSLHGKGAWERNDWVWVLDFKRV